MNESLKELVAIYASVAAHCQPCLEYHMQASIELGVTEKDIRQVCQRISPRGASEGKGIGTVLKIYSLAFSGTQGLALCAKGRDELPT